MKLISNLGEDRDGKGTGDRLDSGVTGKGRKRIKNVVCLHMEVKELQCV